MKLLVYGAIISVVMTSLALGVIAMTVDPQNASTLVKALFFFSFFASFWGLVSLAILAVRSRLRLVRIDQSIFQSSFLYGLYATVLVLISIVILRV